MNEEARWKRWTSASRASTLVCVQQTLYDTDVRRVELERRLRAVGWAPTGQTSGKHHRVWTHPDRELKLYVPDYDLIPDAVGQRILEDAEG